MDEYNIGIIEAIEVALEAEQQARDFYREAVNKVKSGQGKDLLSQLAEFEQYHFDALTTLKNSLTKEHEYVPYVKMNFKEFRVQPISKQIEPEKDDVLNILSLAIEAEEKAHHHYVRMAESTVDRNGKEMFLQLAEEELLHRRILSDEFYQLSNKGGVWFWGD